MSAQARSLHLEDQRAEALVAFFGGGGAAAASPIPSRSVGSSVALSSLICAVIGTLSFLAPLAVSGEHAWVAGARMLLFCHLG